MHRVLIALSCLAVGVVLGWQSPVRAASHSDVELNLGDAVTIPSVDWRCELTQARNKVLFASCGSIRKPKNGDYMVKVERGNLSVTRAVPGGSKIVFVKPRPRK